LRFHEFLRTTVLMSAGSATALALVTLAGVAGGGHALLVAVAVGWWLVGGWVGIWVSRESGTSQAIGSLLAAARSQRSLPEVSPALTVLNRLWPLMVLTVAAAGIGVVEPQIPAIAAGFAIGWALAWRRQASAVRAIEDRDGARFYVDRTSPLSAIRLVRTPGFRATPEPANGSVPSPTAQPQP
jgi:hypothetical protein